MRYFLLDKDYLLKQPSQARVIAISDTKFKNEDVENAKKKFNTSETIEYVGDDIPHHIQYDIENNIIRELKVREKVEVVDIEPISKPTVIFDETTEIDPNVNYFYINKYRADREGISEINAVFGKPLINPSNYFGFETYMIKGSYVPHFVTIEHGCVRESTEYEKYQRGQRELSDNEVIIDSQKAIVTINEGQYLENDKVITVTKPRNMVIPKWDKHLKVWIETATKEEQLEFLKQEILKYTRELMVYKESGFSNDELQNKINSLVEKHKLLSEELATSIEYYAKK